MHFRWIITFAAALLVNASAMPATAQTCDDFDPCTNEEMCTESGECIGTPGNTGATCDDFMDCTVNDRCAAGGCAGESAANGTPCGGGCGECQSLTPFPIPGVPPQCVGDPEDEGKLCDFGASACLVGACSIFETAPGLPAIAFCIPELRECPDTDGNPCTDNCNFETGNCERNFPKCFATCATCDTTSGECEPSNEGVACDDFNQCTGSSRCEGGLCREGEATAPTPTATQPGGPTPTATRPPTGACVGDCGEDGEVAINELITGVNIALGNAAIDTCPSFDTNDDGSVAVNELIGGVNALLNGCAG